MWITVILTLHFSILLPTITLYSLSLEEIDKLKTDLKSSSIKKTFPKYKCQDCHDAFVFKAELSRHILKVHYQGEKFKCECGQLHRHKSRFYECRSSHRSSGFSCKVVFIKRMTFSLMKTLSSNRSVNGSLLTAEVFGAIGKDCTWKNTGLWTT